MSDKSLVFDTETNSWDYEYSNGDAVTDLLETQIYLALFSDARAVESEVLKPEYRRGFWGIIFGDDSGSKLWLNNGRKTQENLNKIVDYAKKALNFLIESGKLKKISVNGEFTTDGIELNINITYNNGSTKLINVGV